MASEILSQLISGIYFQTGNGVPTHLASKSSLFIDRTNAVIYQNKNGLSNWEVLSGGTGSQSSQSGITGFTYNSSTNTLIIGSTGGTFSATINSFSGLTIYNPLTIIDGNQNNKFLLTSDSGGTATWQALSQNTVQFSANTNNQTLFTSLVTQTPYDITKVELYVNGQKQLYNLDYTITGSTLNWLNNHFTISTDDLLEIIYL
jgi:hypothetical protein